MRRHFVGADDEGDGPLVTNYFDKLIQVPIRVPPLGIQEVRAYMMLLFVEDSSLPTDVKERIRVGFANNCGTLGRVAALTRPSSRPSKTTCRPS